MSKDVRVGQTYRMEDYFLGHMLEHGYGRANHPIRGDLCVIVELRDDGKFVTVKNLTRPEKGDLVTLTSLLLDYASLVEEEPR